MYIPVMDVVGLASDLNAIDPDFACDCPITCDETCPCTLRSGGFPYSSEKLLSRISASSLPIFECMRECACSQTCRNRLVQLGGVSHLQVVPYPGKGLGVQTIKKIRQGSYIAQYLGLYVSQPLDGPYVFELRESFGTKEYCLQINAEIYGNVTRFFNHSCEPNMVVQPVRIESTIPKIAFFASRDIAAELGQDHKEFVYVGVEPAEDSYEEVT